METGVIFLFVLVTGAVILFVYLLPHLIRKSSGRKAVNNSPAKIKNEVFDTLELKLLKLKTEVWGEKAGSNTSTKNHKNNHEAASHTLFNRTSILPEQFDSGVNPDVVKSKSGIFY